MAILAHASGPRASAPGIPGAHWGEQVSEDSGRPPPRGLERVARWMAYAGVALLLALVAVTVVSVVGRKWFDRAIPGDMEYVQLGCAVAIAWFLPICELRQQNIIVDFFTARASVRTQAALDAFGALLVAAVAAMLAARLWAGLMDKLADGETGQVSGLPLWYAYAGMLPGLAMLVLAALAVALRSIRQGWR